MCSGSCVVECANVTCKSQATINGDSSGTDYANGNSSSYGTSGNFGCGTASCGYDCSTVCGKGVSCRASNADYGVYGSGSGSCYNSACSAGCSGGCTACTGGCSGNINKEKIVLNIFMNKK